MQLPESRIHKSVGGYGYVLEICCGIVLCFRIKLPNCCLGWLKRCHTYIYIFGMQIHGGGHSKYWASVALCFPRWQLAGFLQNHPELMYYFQINVDGRTDPSRKLDPDTSKKPALAAELKLLTCDLKKIVIKITVGDKFQSCWCFPLAIWLNMLATTSKSFIWKPLINFRGGAIKSTRIISKQGNIRIVKTDGGLVWRGKSVCYRI